MEIEEQVETKREIFVNKKCDKSENAIESLEDKEVESSQI